MFVAVAEVLTGSTTDVQENVTKVGKQIEHGEIRLASLLVIAAPDLTDEDGLPIMDIREELDEEDNVVGQLYAMVLCLRHDD